MEALLQQEGVDITHILLYKQGMGMEMRDTIENIHDIWGVKYAVLITPAITVGNSFAPGEDHPSNFDCTFLFRYPSCTARTAMQMHMRVRYTKCKPFPSWFLLHQNITSC